MIDIVPPEDGPLGPKHVVVKDCNKIKKTFQLRLQAYIDIAVI
jgi:hypothetical protein